MWLNVLSRDFQIAAECLNQLIEARAPGTILLNCLPITHEFRQDPRVRELLRKIGLPEE
jgi:hypothetical protein